MARLSAAALVVVLLAGLVTTAQGGDSMRATPVKGINLSGTVASDAKTLLADDDNVWSVDNAQVLKGFERRYVTVTCRMDPAKRSIHVLSVSRPDASHVHLNDSAFHR